MLLKARRAGLGTKFRYDCPLSGILVRYLAIAKFFVMVGEQMAVVEVVSSQQLAL